MFSGPDVSEHQGNIEWSKVATEHQLAIVRVADGDHRDPRYSKERVKAIREAGLLLPPTTSPALPAPTTTSATAPNSHKAPAASRRQTAAAVARATGHQFGHQSERK